MPFGSFFVNCCNTSTDKIALSQYFRCSSGCSSGCMLPFTVYSGTWLHPGSRQTLTPDAINILCSASMAWIRKCIQVIMPPLQRLIPGSILDSVICECRWSTFSPIVSLHRICWIETRSPMRLWRSLSLQISSCCRCDQLKLTKTKDNRILFIVIFFSVQVMDSHRYTSAKRFFIVP